MSFEPLIHISVISTVLIVALGAGLATFVIGGLSYMDLRHKKREMTEQLFFTRISVPFIVCCAVIFACLQTNVIAKNETIVRTNVSQKYDVQEIQFTSSTGKSHYRDYYPEQSQSQPVMIKSRGVTRPANLIQNPETSEPTLLDVDNGKPLDDLLRVHP